ncbi:MAG: hypothetical protein QXW79_01220 [Thermoplasmata archaeon]
MYAENITQEEVLERGENLQELDEAATQNICAMVGKETHENISSKELESFGGSRFDVNSSLHHDNDPPMCSGGGNINLIAELTKHYAGREEVRFRKNQVGGYDEQKTEKHFSKSYLSEIGGNDSGENDSSGNDSFVSRRKNEFLRRYDNFPPSSGGRKKMSNVSESRKYDTSISGSESHTRLESDNSDVSDLPATEDLRLTTVSPKVKRTTSKLKKETYSSDWKTEDFRLSSISENKIGGKGNNSEEREKSEESLTSSIFDNDDESSLERVRRRRRVHNPKTDELYKSFLQKIMDHLGVDEENARIYRSAIKYYIGQDNPELRKMENDELRIKEMEKIISDKDKLEEYINSKNINIEDVKRNMEKQREEQEKRRREFREKRRKKFEINKSDEIPEEKPKKSRRKVKVAENGYLESDELIFSPKI